jgi:serine/threonine-protein kinase RsbW
VPADNIELVLPATPEYARIARLTVAGLASRGGFGYDDVEDLRIAVGEACSLLLQRSTPGDSLRFSFDLDGHTLRIEAEHRGGDPAGSPEETGASGPDHDLSEQILDAVVDEAEIDAGGRALRLVKVRSGA